MILSASRRTDLPSWYFPWFLNRLKERFVLVRNPFNPRQLSRVALGPELIGCIVFWTKNPAPMLSLLDRLGDIPFYVQFTLNPYGPEMERNLPPKEALLDTFKRLSDSVGPERAVWRYSPVLLSARYTPSFHLDSFGRLAEALRGRARQCKLSFLDLYAKIEKNMARQGAAVPDPGEAVTLARQLAAIAGSCDIEPQGCVSPELAEAGITPAPCIDPKLIGRITGTRPALKKDPGQRAECLCAASVDVGAYNTCLSGCAYCYANHSGSLAKAGNAEYDPAAPMLCDKPSPQDKITERKTGEAGEKRRKRQCSSN